MNVQNHDLGKRTGAYLLTLALALALTACGGGGGNPGATVGVGGGTGAGSGSGGIITPAAPTVTVGFVNGSGQATNSLTGAGQLTVKATVLDKAGKPVPKAVVAFATDNTLAVFSGGTGTASGNGTALTDDNGVASISMRAASLASSGAGTVTATSTVDKTSASGSANFSVGSTALTFGTLVASPNSVSAYGSTVLSVDVLAGSNKYTDQQVNVNFSSACVAAGKASLAPVVGTNNGTAQAVYRDQGCGNNDLVTATATGIVKPVTVQLTIAAPTAASVQFEKALPVGQSIVIKGQGGNGRTETASLTFRVVDIFNHPLSGATVDFSPSTNVVTVNKTSDTTDQNGEVITTVNSGSVPTSFRVKASLHDNASVFTWSDSMVVTTGQPVQRAFSLSPGKYNLDSTIESNPGTPATNINVMIADTNGNPVPDGTPVVFQTNMGSVGSASQGGCITTNGGCSVDFRMQDPRVATPGLPATPCNASTPDNTRPGVATVCASTTDGTNTVFGKLELNFSGKAIGRAYMNGDITKPIVMSSVTDLGSSSSSVPYVFSLLLTDDQDNPLPTGTTIGISGVTNATAQPVLPPTVGNLVPGTITSGPRGTIHTFTVANNPNPCVPATSTFNVTATTPGGNTSYIPFKLAFSCP
jgi:protocatechuate 3,4-dioxygenase beta subunit